VAAAQPKSSPAATNAATNTAANTAAQKQPAKEAAPRNATLLVASLDKGAAPAPALGAASNQTAAGGPAVKAEGDAPAPAVPFRSGPLRPISGGILNGKALNLPMPSYPDAAKRARISGTVEVEVVIDINGKVISAKAVRGPGMLQLAAETAARQARFTPTLLSGQPMKVVGVITYNFTLQQ
jgi:protein TonB